MMVLTWKVVYKSTVESNSTYWGWLPGTKDHRNHFCQPSAVYDTVNHRLLIQKFDNTKQYSKLCRVIQNLLSNRKFWVKLSNNQIKKKVLAPTLLNIYTNDHPIHDVTRSFIYADDLCITAQYQSFKQVVETIEEVLDNITWQDTTVCMELLKKKTSHCVPSQEQRCKQIAKSGRMKLN